MLLPLLFIGVVCYVPILNEIIPKIDLGRGLPNIDMARLLSYLMSILFFLTAAIRKTTRFWHPWIGIVVLYSFIVFASVGWGGLRYSSSVIRYLFDTVCMPILFSAVALNIFRDYRNINLYIVNIVAVGSILGGIAIYQMLDAMVSGNEIRASATFDNPNGLAIFLVLIIPCINYAFDRKIIPTIFSWPVFVLVAGGIISTASRKGLFTAIFSFSLYFLLQREYRKLIVAGTFILIFSFIAGGGFLVSGRLSEETLDKDLERKEALRDAGIEMFKSSPVIGLGFEGYQRNYNRFFINSEKENYDAHNIFITALSDYGLAGFIPFLSIMLLPAFYSARVIFEKTKWPAGEISRDFAVISIATVLPFMVNGYYAGGLFFNEKILLLLYTHSTFVFFCDQPPPSPGKSNRILPSSKFDE